MKSESSAKDHLTPAHPPPPTAGGARARGYGRRRALVLATIYLLIAVHITHWRLAGKTLAPLELNEVMYTFEIGVITAGFLFMAVALLSVLIFGRFFCSWGCHILALQDLCAWLLKTIRIRPRPVTSRVLRFVPLGVMSIMFVWPTLRRLVVMAWPSATSLVGQPPDFRLRVLTDSQGWASFVTTDFWRNLPGPELIIATFAVCGFAIVYLLGTRSFCNYVCPYGAVFGLADRAAPGRIRLTGDCLQCGTCTATCQSNIFVHDEIARYGMVVSPGCFKDLDCVSACPQNAISYGFGRPALFARARSRGRHRPRTAGRREELGLFAVFFATLLIFTGLPRSIAPVGPLYGVLPLFLSAALAVVTAFAVMYMWRLARWPRVRFQRIRLKSKGRVRRPGLIFLTLSTLWVVLVAHSALIQYHMFRVGRVIEQTADLRPAVLRQDAAVVEWMGGDGRVAVAAAEHHLTRAQALGLFADARIPRQRAWLALVRGDHQAAEQNLLDAIAMAPRHPDSYYQAGRVRALRGDFAGAARMFIDAGERSPEGGRFKDAVMKGAGQLLLLGLGNEALSVVEEAIGMRPGDVELRVRYSAMAARLGRALLGSDRTREAIPHLRRALDHSPADTDIRADLARAYMQLGEHDRAEVELLKNVKVPSAEAGSLYMLGELRRLQGREGDAVEFFRRAHALNPRFPLPDAVDPTRERSR